MAPKSNDVSSERNITHSSISHKHFYGLGGAILQKIIPLPLCFRDHPLDATIEGNWTPRHAANKNIFIPQSVWSKELNNFHRNNISAFALQTWRKHFVFQVRCWSENLLQQSAKITILKCGIRGWNSGATRATVCKSFLQQCRCIFVWSRESYANPQLNMPLLIVSALPAVLELQSAFFIIAVSHSVCIGLWCSETTYITWGHENNQWYFN